MIINLTFVNKKPKNEGNLFAIFLGSIIKRFIINMRTFEAKADNKQQDLSGRKKNEKFNIFNLDYIRLMGQVQGNLTGNDNHFL